MSEIRAGRSSCRLAHASTTSANSRDGSDSIPEVRSMAFSQVFAGDVFAGDVFAGDVLAADAGTLGGGSAGLSMTSVFMAVQGLESLRRYSPIGLTRS